MKTPTEGFRQAFKENGCKGPLIRTHSYVAVICEIDGDQVHAVRYDGYERKTDVYKAVTDDYPGWKMKLVNRLYDEDFTE